MRSSSGSCVCHQPSSISIVSRCVFLLPAHTPASSCLQCKQRVAQCMRLSELQMLHMCIGCEEYQRLCRAATAEGNALLSQAAAPSLVLAAAAAAQQQQQQQQAGGCRSRSADCACHASTPGSDVAAAAAEAAVSIDAAAAGIQTPARGSISAQQQQQQQHSMMFGRRAGSSGSNATDGMSGLPSTAASDSDRAAAAAAAVFVKEEPNDAAADVADDAAADLSQRLDSRLQRHVRSRHAQLRMMAMFYLNTLTRLQIAQMVRERV
jgi:hypothetical protein